jgi:hypothetical protein
MGSRDAEREEGGLDELFVVLSTMGHRLEGSFHVVRKACASAEEREMMVMVEGTRIRLVKYQMEIANGLPWRNTVIYHTSQKSSGLIMNMSLGPTSVPKRKRSTILVNSTK